MDNKSLENYVDTHTCITGSLIGQNAEGSVVKVIPLYCNKWYCDHCSKHKTSLWRRVAVSGRPDRFITLTLKEDKRMYPLTQAKIIKKALPKLVTKIRKTWGAFEYMLVFELTKKRTPHVHILARGSYISKSWLSREWQKLTGAFIVDIRKVKSNAEAANYITKYMGKALGDVSAELQGLRIIQRSKSYCIPDPEDPDAGPDEDDEDPLEWIFCTYTPWEAARRLQGAFGWKWDAKPDDPDIQFRGPPDSEIVTKLIWPLLEREN